MGPKTPYYKNTFGNHVLFVYVAIIDPSPTAHTRGCMEFSFDCCQWVWYVHMGNKVD